MSFFKSFCVPVVLIFLIPSFSLWFFHHAQNKTDREIFEAIESEIAQDAELSQEEKDDYLRFFRETPASVIMASDNPEWAELRQTFSKARIRYTTFRWMIRFSIYCLVTGAGAFIFVGLSVLLSFSSQLMQYWSLSIGWQILKLISVIQVVCQSALCVALSYWITALWAERYFPKLVLLAGIGAICAVGMMIWAIIKPLHPDSEIEGRLLDEFEAAKLWSQIQELCGRLGLQKPDQIVAGIDDNFFVTEHPVTVQGVTHTGRTLFVSLALLKILSMQEANAVLAHEMAHFSGADTIYSKKISPLMSRYGEYLGTLYANVISRPVFYFMLFFWSMYQLSLNRLSRHREFRADAIAAELTSPQAMARSLVKIIIYSNYRHQVQSELFAQEHAVESMNIISRIEAGFNEFARACVQDQHLGGEVPSHPFDSHPPLKQRLDAVGMSLGEALNAAVLDPVFDSWHSQINNADQIEAEQWAHFEEEFRKYHEATLPYRMAPSNEQEREIVVRYFPEVSFKHKKENLELILDYEKLRLTEWAEPIHFSAVVNMIAEESFGSVYVTILHQKPIDDSAKKTKLNISKFETAAKEIWEIMQKYYGRHMVAKEWLQQKASEEANGADPNSGS
ncbi:M48 family metallopeptidase [Candidatus Sumerlaeota bacterium]|nr:M48 family metallopeptidase [Candidatus Sumerlaeota bacterium]